MTDNPNIVLIVAVDSKNGISKNGSIPWTINEDSNFFQDVTKKSYIKGKQNVVIMGKNTYFVTKGLKDRINIVVTSESLEKEDILTVKTLDEGIKLAKKLNPGKIFICGGKRIYEETMNYNKYHIDEFYITRIHKDYNCDNILDIPLDNKKGKCYDFVLEDITVEFFRTNNKSNNEEEQNYLNLLEYILKSGHYRKTRNSETWSVFGKSLTFDLTEGFPLLTTKKVFFKGIVEELLFFLKGDTNTKKLFDKGVKIWEDNTSKDFLNKNGLDYDEGDMGPMYGFNLLHYGTSYKGMNENYEGKGFNQIEYCLNLLKNDPFSRRIIMTTFNPAQAHEGVLYPCHGISIMFNVDKNWKLSCIMFQRSADACCGIPFNIASYALLIHLFCEVINNDENYKGRKFTPGKLIMNFGDTHIYKDHCKGAIRQILREPYKFPTLKISTKRNFNEYIFEDFELCNYESYPAINFKMVA